MRIPEGSVVVTIRNECRECGDRFCAFSVDPPASEALVKSAIEKQKRHIAKLHHGHTYSLHVKAEVHVSEVSNA